MASACRARSFGQQPRGLLSLVATITSLYPAATIVWARLVLGERIRLLQGVGLGFAALAIFLIAW